MKIRKKERERRAEKEERKTIPTGLNKKMRKMLRTRSEKKKSCIMTAFLRP